MTDSDIIAAIEKACGWIFEPSLDVNGHAVPEAWRSEHFMERVYTSPMEDCLESLNVIALAEKTLNACEWEAYRTNLIALVDPHYHNPRLAINASARQRAMAFLQTKGLEI